MLDPEGLCDPSEPPSADPLSRSSQEQHKTLLCLHPPSPRACVCVCVCVSLHTHTCTFLLLLPILLLLQSLFSFLTLSWWSRRPPQDEKTSRTCRCHPPPPLCALAACFLWDTSWHASKSPRPPLLLHCPGNAGLSLVLSRGGGGGGLLLPARHFVQVPYSERRESASQPASRAAKQADRAASLAPRAL